MMRLGSSIAGTNARHPSLAYDKPRPGAGRSGNARSTPSRCATPISSENLVVQSRARSRAGARVRSGCFWCGGSMATSAFRPKALFMRFSIITAWSSAVAGYATAHAVRRYWLFLALVILTAVRFVVGPPRIEISARESCTCGQVGLHPHVSRSILDLSDHPRFS